MKLLSLSTCVLDPTLGSGKTRLRWSEGLRSRGHAVEMLEPRDYEALHGLRRALRFRQALGASSVVPKKLRTSSYDLVEFFGGEFGLATWRLSRQAQRPMIVAHTDGLELLAIDRERSYDPARTAKDRVRRLFASLTHDRLSMAAFAHADVFVTLCKLDRDYVVERGILPEDQTAVVYPGLDAEYLKRPFSPGGSDCIAYMGSWIPRKGVAILAEVVSRVLNQVPTVRFEVFGASRARDAVLAAFPESQRERITVHGRLSNAEVAEGLARAGVFFFPSQYEGFGMAISEAMACSCAVVTTPTGFGGELTDEHDALICGFDDSAGMERAILRLLRDQTLRLTIAERGWRRVQGMEWNANVAQLESTYLNWVDRYRRGEIVGPFSGRPRGHKVV